MSAVRENLHDDPLSLMGLRYQTDKAYPHWYTPHYHRRFKTMRNSQVRLLEIGIGGYKTGEGGESLLMWRDYFTNPDAVIVGMDIEEKPTPPGCYVEQGDQSNPADLNRIAENYAPFDIIIDDGSHRPDDILQSWVVLWSYLKDDGWYVIEDLQTAYWPSFGGSSVHTGDSTIGFLQGLIDRIHWAEMDIPGYTPNRFDLSVVALEISPNIAFIRKGDNSAPSTIMPPHPHPQMWPDEAP